MNKSFMQLMVEICNTFNLTHLQMMALRHRIEGAYHSQTTLDVSLEAFAIAVHRQLEDGMTINNVTLWSDERLLGLAVEVEKEHPAPTTLNRTQRRLLAKLAKKKANARK